MKKLGCLLLTLIPLLIFAQRPKVEKYAMFYLDGDTVEITRSDGIASFNVAPMSSNTDTIWISGFTKTIDEESSASIPILNDEIYSLGRGKGVLNKIIIMCPADQKARLTILYDL